MYERILLDLLQIVEIEGSDPESGQLTRIKAIHKWMDETLINVKISQSTIKSNFSTDEEDFLKYHLATKMAEELMEEAIEVTIEANKVTTQVVAFKRKNW